VKKPAKSANLRSHRTEIQSYIKLYYLTKIKAGVDEAIRNGGDKTQRLKITTEIARKLYSAESDEVKTEVQANMKKLRTFDTAVNTVLGEDSLPEEHDTLKTQVVLLFQVQVPYTHTTVFADALMHCPAICSAFSTNCTRALVFGSLFIVAAKPKMVE